MCTRRYLKINACVFNYERIVKYRRDCFSYSFEFFSRGSCLIFQLQSHIQSKQPPLRVPHRGGLRSHRYVPASQPASRTCVSLHIVGHGYTTVFWSLQICQTSCFSKVYFEMYLHSAVALTETEIMSWFRSYGLDTVDVSVCTDI